MPGERLVRDRDAVTTDAIDVAIVANPPPGSLAGLPRLKLVQSLWAGVDRLLLDGSVPTDVPLARMVDPAMNTAMAQTPLSESVGRDGAVLASKLVSRHRRSALRRAWPAL